MATFGERLKQLRTENKLTRRSLSNDLNITERMLLYYETDKSSPNSNVIKVICTRFNISADYFLGLSDERTNIRAN
jgi:transcriptional regulator with XRE-family HTH domain